MNCIPKVDERPLPEARSGSVVEKNDQFGTSADILFDNNIFLSMSTFQKVFFQKYFTGIQKRKSHLFMAKKSRKSHKL